MDNRSQLITNLNDGSLSAEIKIIRDSICDGFIEGMKDGDVISCCSNKEVINSVTLKTLEPESVKIGDNVTYTKGVIK